MDDVIIFGHGRYYKSKEKNIKKTYKIMAFIDNSIREDEVLSEENIPIYNPKRLRELPSVPVIIMSVNFWEMAMQLTELGVADENILFGSSMLPCYNHIEEIFNELNCSIKVENKKFVLLYDTEKYIFENEQKYKEILRKIVSDKDPYIKLIADMPLNPLSRRFGLEYGKAIDRFYIEKFLADNKSNIKGIAMEIAEDRYTKMFGENVVETMILHVNGWGGMNVIKGNLATGEGLVENSVDCLICTQTLQFIYDIHSVVKNIYKVLKPGGTAMITVPLLSQLSLYDYQNWGCYWRFTDQSMKKILLESFDEREIKVYTYGNMKAAMAFLYGICQEEMRQSDLEYYDEQFPLIIGATCRKK